MERSKSQWLFHNLSQNINLLFANINGRETSTLERLEDYNCYHCKTSIICGISDPRYSEKELADLKARDERTFDIDGHEMTVYEASKAMRRLETGIREQKGIKAMAQVSGDPLAVRETGARIKRYQDKYSEISDITGIAQDKKRMTLTGTKKSDTIKPLPKVENAEISKNKFTGYALNPLKDENKAKAFESALGYTSKNADELIANIRSNLNNFTAVEKPDNGYGKRYEVIMALTGANGKKANIKTAWIIDKDSNKSRLTSAYVTKKKFKEE